MAEKKPESEKKEQLIKKIQEVKQEANGYEDIGRSIVERGRFVKDVADAAEQLVNRIPDDKCIPVNEWDRQIEGWRNSANGIRVAKIDLDTQMIASFTFSVTSTTLIGFPQTISTPLQPIEQKWINTAVDHLNEVFEKANITDQVETHIRRLRLDIRQRGRQNALDLLNGARDALFRPPSANTLASSVLLPIREAIHRILGDLLQRRRDQESTPKASDKVRSIVTQCGRSQIHCSDIESLALEADRLVKELSSSKQDVIPRREVRSQFVRTCTFLKTLLESIDETKLK